MPKLELRVTDCTPEQAVAIAAYIAKLNGGSGHDLNVTQAAAELAQAPAAPRPQPPAPPSPPVMATAPQPPSPPAAPQPPAPPVPSTPPTVTSGELDKRGVPWHADHHAATKGQTKDGAWMRKKGSDKDVVAAYEAQFTHRPAAPQPPAPPVTAPPAPPSPPVAPAYPTAGPTGAPAYPTAAQINAQHAPHLPPQGETVPPPAPVVHMPAPPAPPSPPVVQHVPTYAEFYQKYMDLLEAKLMTGDQARQINERVGAITGAEYADNEPMRAAAWAEFIALENMAQAA